MTIEQRTILLRGSSTNSVVLTLVARRSRHFAGTRYLKRGNSEFLLQCVATRCSMLQCVAVCCSVLQCVAVCCSVLQCVAVCCSVLCGNAQFLLQCGAVCCSVMCCSVLHRVASCCRELPEAWGLQHTQIYIATYCDALQLTTLQYTATHCNTLQHTATCCNKLQHTATHYPTLQPRNHYLKPRNFESVFHWERERERDGESVCVCGRECVYVCMCVCRREKFRVCEKETSKER